MRALSASCLAVATALFFVATPAQARFGRSDNQNQGNGNNGNHNGNGNGNGGGNHGNSGGNGGGGGGGNGHTHEATPVTNPDGHSNGHGQGHVQHGNGNGYGHDRDRDGDHEYDPASPNYVHELYGSDYVGYQPVIGYDPAYDNPSNNERLRLFLLGEGTRASDSLTLAGSARIDGRSWGFVLDGRALFFSADPGVDVINLAHAHLTYAFLSGPNGRVRAEVGAAAAFAEQLTAMGPSLGVSADIALVWGFSVEASSHVVPYPYQAFEYSVGASFAYAEASIHLGWRSIYLDDAGLVDGVSHSDSSTGPYLALGLTF